MEHWDINWICTRCALPNFSESFLEDNHSKQSEQLIAESENAPLMAINRLKQLRDENRKKCIIANSNINSFPNKFEEISEWLSSKSVDILSIQETKIDRTFPNSQFNVQGFNLFRRDRKKGGGGIAVYISENIVAQQKKVTMCKSLETILLDLRIGQRRFALVSAYKPPSVDNSTFTLELSRVLDEQMALEI